MAIIVEIKMIIEGLYFKFIYSVFLKKALSQFLSIII